MLNPHLIHSFVEVVNRSTMAEAARQLKITPAAISKHILTLENELGVQLFLRTTRRLDLTQEGIIFFEHAKTILDAHQQAEAALSQTKEEPAGSLKVVCGPQIAYLYVIPFLKEFIDRYPRINLHVDVAPTMPDVEKDHVDIVVGLTSGIPQHWMQRTITYTRWVCCATPEYLEKHGTPNKLSDLHNHYIITRDKRNPNNVLWFKGESSVVYSPFMYFNDTRAIRRAILQGLGIAQLHDYIVNEDIKSGKLVEVLGKFSEPKQTIPVHMSYFPSSHLHSKVRVFLDFMIEVAERLNS